MLDKQEKLKEIQRKKENLLKKVKIVCDNEVPSEFSFQLKPECSVPFRIAQQIGLFRLSYQDRINSYQSNLTVGVFIKNRLCDSYFHRDCRVSICKDLEELDTMDIGYVATVNKDRKVTLKLRHNLALVPRFIKVENHWDLMLKVSEETRICVEDKNGEVTNAVSFNEKGHQIHNSLLDKYKDGKYREPNNFRY